jgi:hypothetical protein
MIGFSAAMLLADLTITGFATLPLSHTSGGAHPSVASVLGRWSSIEALANRAIETSFPQDWVGFVIQLHHQRSGGPSYLLGERRMTGWWYYYLVALAVKVPLSFWLLVIARAGHTPSEARDRCAWMLPLYVAAFLVVTAVGSSRNYGFRYLLPLAPLGVIWVSGLAECARWRPWMAWSLLTLQAASVASIHPYELTYFNALSGGRWGGRAILSDSNLDWGQGLKELARLQAGRPELRDMTLYYFGDTQPSFYHVAGNCHVIDAVGSPPGPPRRFEASTRFVAVSASLQWGPWAEPGYFQALNGLAPIAYTPDTTIAIYESSAVFPRTKQSDQ